MALYSYNAVDARGRTIKGTLQAETQESAIARLREMDLRVLEITERPLGPRWFASIQEKLQRVSLKEIAIFSRQFSTMIDAGIHVVRCLDVLSQQTTNPKLKAVASMVSRDVTGGSSLADALAKHPTIFTPLYVNMVRAAELGGILDKILQRLATFLEKEQEMKDKIRSALMYPTAIAAFAFVMFLVMIFFILPMFGKMFKELEMKTLPLPTRIVLGAGDLMTHYWYIGLIVIIGLFIAIRQYGKTEKGRLNIDRLKLRLPIVGELVRKAAISKFARTFGTLIGGGVHILQALDIVAGTSGNKVIALAVKAAENAVKAGEKLEKPLRESKVFPEMVTHMVAVGEETGKLDSMLTRISDFYDAEVDTAIRGLTSLLEPVIMIGLGIVIMIFALAIYMPMFSMMDQIQKMK